MYLKTEQQRGAAHNVEECGGYHATPGVGFWMGKINLRIIYRVPLLRLGSIMPVYDRCIQDVS